MTARAARLAVAGLAFLAVTVLALEASVRRIIPQALAVPQPELYRPVEGLGWARRPNARVTMHVGREVAFCTDGRGDRIDCDADPARACARRVLVIGDSFVEALGVPYGETVWGWMERELGVCAEIAGVGGWGLGQYVAVARDRLSRSGPYDLVLLAFYAGNDFTRRIAETPALRPRALRSIARAGAGGPAPAGGLRRWLRAHFHAWVAAERAWGRLRDPLGGYGGHGSRVLRRSTLRDEMLEETERGIGRIAREVRQAGSRLLVVVIPHEAQVLDPRGSRLVALLPELRGDVDMDRVTRDFMPRLRGVPDVDAVVDLLPVLRERARADAWGSDRHFSALGHRLWFEAIREPATRLMRAS